MKNETLSLLGTTARVDKIKKSLLTYDLFLDNEYLTKYIEFLLNNQIIDSSLDYCNNHHMIPVAYYKIVNNISNSKKARKIANSDVNNIIIKLEYKNHILAHYYLCLCVKEPLLFKMSVAFFKLVNRRWLYTDFNPETDLEEFNNIYVKYIDYLRKINSKPLTESAKLKLSNYWSNRKRGPWTEERKLEASIRIKNDYKNNRRKHSHNPCSEETKLKISCSNKGKVCKSRKKVICIETQQIFDSVLLAAKYANVNSATMSACCNNYKYHICKGYHYVFLNDTKLINSLSQFKGKDRYSDLRGIENVSRSLKQRHLDGKMLNKTRKKVLCITTNKTFSSLTQASKYGNISVGTLCCHLKGLSKTCGALKNGTRLCWRYL